MQNTKTFPTRGEAKVAATRLARLGWTNPKVGRVRTSGADEYMVTAQQPSARPGAVRYRLCTDGELY